MLVGMHLLCRVVGVEHVGCVLFEVSILVARLREVCEAGLVVMERLGMVGLVTAGDTQCKCVVDGGRFCCG